MGTWQLVVIPPRQSQNASGSCIEETLIGSLFQSRIVLRKKELKKTWLVVCSWKKRGEPFDSRSTAD